MSNARKATDFLLPTADFNHLFETAIDHARELLTEHEGYSFIPVSLFTVYDAEEGNKTIYAVMPDLEIERRHQQLEAFGTLLAEQGHLVMSFIFVCEAWRSINPDYLGGNRPMPREDPNRIESIVAMGQTIEGRTAMSYLDVARDDSNRMYPMETTHCPYVDSSDDQRESPLCQAFWKGYRVGLLGKIMSQPGGKQLVEEEMEKASGIKPEARNAKFN